MSLDGADPVVLNQAFITFSVCLCSDAELISCVKNENLSRVSLQTSDQIWNWSWENRGMLKLFFFFGPDLNLHLYSSLGQKKSVEECINVLDLIPSFHSLLTTDLENIKNLLIIISS